MFSSGEPDFLKMMMSKMDTYEKISTQLVNKSKSGFYVEFKDDDTLIHQIKKITRFNY